MPSVTKAHHDSWFWTICIFSAIQLFVKYLRFFLQSIFLTALKKKERSRRFWNMKERVRNKVYEFLLHQVPSRTFKVSAFFSSSAIYFSWQTVILFWVIWEHQGSRMPFYHLFYNILENRVKPNRLLTALMLVGLEYAQFHCAMVDDTCTCKSWNTKERWEMDFLIWLCISVSPGTQHDSYILKHLHFFLQSIFLANFEFEKLRGTGRGGVSAGGLEIWQRVKQLNFLSYSGCTQEEGGIKYLTCAVPLTAPVILIGRSRVQLVR